MVDRLSQVSLFKGMTDEQITGLLTLFGSNSKNYQQEEIIAIEGQPCSFLGIVIEGQVLITKEDSNGQRYIITKLGQARVFGEMVAFSSRQTWPATVVATQQSRVLFLEVNRFFSTIGQLSVAYQQFVKNYLTELSDKSLLLNHKISYLTLKKVRPKIARYLLEVSRQKEQQSFKLPFNRNEMADFLNVSRPSLSRELARMKKEELIDYYQNSFKIVSVRQLEMASYEE